MKTKLFKVTLCVVAFAIVATVWIKVQSVERFSDIQLSNIEALANNEHETQTCTRIAAWVTCYDKDGNWNGMSITAIETYEVKSDVEICEHARLTSCPKI